MKFPQPIRTRLFHGFLLVFGIFWIWHSAVPSNMVTNGAIPAPQTGFSAPDFTLASLDGENIQLSALKGRVVLVNIWASWCPPCKAEMPAIDRVYQRYKDKGFSVLGVDSTVQDTVVNLNAFVSENKPGFPILLDEKGLVTRLYNVQSLPSSFFIGADGIVRNVVIGGPMSEAFLESQVEKYLKRGTLMLPTIQIGPLAFPVPQLSLLAAIWIGLTLAEKQAPKYNISIEALYGLVFSGLITGVVGARLAYVVQYPDAFIQSPVSLISLNAGLLNPESGFVFGVLAMLIYAQRAKLSIWNALDALTPILAVFAVGLAVSHLASGESFGSPADLPWSVNLWGARRHPTQVYELIGSLIILGYLFWRPQAFRLPGATFLTFAALFAGETLFLEAFHGDSTTTMSGLRVGQIYAWMVLALILWIMEYRNHNLAKKGTENG